MQSIYESIKAFCKLAPTMNVYEKRIDCFEKLGKLQQQIRVMDEEYTKVSALEGQSNTSAWNSLEDYTKQYKQEYERCEKIIKY